MGKPTRGWVIQLVRLKSLAFRKSPSTISFFLTNSFSNPQSTYTNLCLRKSASLIAASHTQKAAVSAAHSSVSIYDKNMPRHGVRRTNIITCFHFGYLLHVYSNYSRLKLEYPQPGILVLHSDAIIKVGAREETCRWIYSSVNQENIFHVIRQYYVHISQLRDKCNL